MPVSSPIPNRMYPRESFVPAGRALHLIDIENLMGGPQAGWDAIPLATEGYLATVSMTPDDLVVVATNPHLWLPAKLAWPGALVLSGHGRDGADKVLISQVSDVDRVARRIDRLVIGSGDGIFESIAREYTVAGIPVEVLSRQDALSDLLRAEVTSVTVLPDQYVLGTQPLRDSTRAC